MPASSAPDDAFTLERADRLEDLRADWTRLAEATGHPFATWEWNARWWEHFGQGRELLTFACQPPRIYHHDWQVQFPKGIRQKGGRYVVTGLREAARGGFYRTYGEVRRLL